MLVRPTRRPCWYIQIHTTIGAWSKSAPATVFTSDGKAARGQSSKTRWPSRRPRRRQDSRLVNYETSWYRSNHAAYDLAHEGDLGDVRKVVIHDGHNGPKEIGVEPEFLAWLTDPKLNGGGALFDFGCYGADLMTFLMDGQRPQTVTAVTQTFKPEIYSRVDDEATIILTYPKAQAIVQASWNWPFGRKDMEVYGQTGYAITVQANDIRVRRGGENAEQQIAAKPVAAPYDNSISYSRAVVLDEPRRTRSHRSRPM